MGNTPLKSQQATRNNKKVHWKSAELPSPPGKPQLVPGTPETKPDCVTIRWDRPKSDGGSAITGYLVEHRRTGSPHWVRATPITITTPELTLSGLEPGWRYQFRVTAENAVGLSEPSDLSDPLTVTLQRSAICAPRFTEELKDAVAIENEHVEFIVNVLGTPIPQISWFKDGFEIFSSRRIRIITENNTSVLTIHQTSFNDEGEIKCTATNRAGHVVTKARLKLEAPPRIRLPRQYEDGLLFEADDIIRLKIALAGRPAPSVTWSHNGDTLKHEGRHEIVSTDKSASLRINAAKRTDRGEYQLRAVNKLGEDVASFLVTITDRPQPPGKAVVTMTLGKSVSLTWTAPDDDGGCKIGNYIVEYYRVGWDVWLKAATCRQLNTTLGDLLEGSEYKFRIKAESPYGVSDPSPESDILFIPDVKRGITEPVRTKNQEIELTVPPVAPRRRHTPTSISSSKSSLEEEKLSPNNNVKIQNQSPITIKRTEKNVSADKNPSFVPNNEGTEKTAIKEAITKNVFDRSSITRELSYGSPDNIYAKRKEQIIDSNGTPPARKLPYEAIYGRPKIVAAETNTSMPKSVTVDAQDQTNNKPRVSIQKDVKLSTQELATNRRSTSPLLTVPKEIPAMESQTNAGPRENDEMNMHGSSEFMLVLYPEKDHKPEPTKRHSVGFEMDDAPPPPLSLSAPELGSDPMTPPMRASVSSTELLYERAMARFYHAVALEESEKARNRRQSIENRSADPLPRIRINSLGDDDISNQLQRNNSIVRRRLSGGPGQQQILMHQKRQSLRNSTDGIDKLALTQLIKERSASIEKISKLSNENPSNVDKSNHNSNRNSGEFNEVTDKILKANIARNDSVEDDYSDSTASSDGESQDERFRMLFKTKHTIDDEEDTTYHPRSMQPRNIISQQIVQREQDQAAEVLTKPAPLPDPDYIPKPILKRRDQDTNIKSESKLRASAPVKPERKSLKLDEKEQLAPEGKSDDNKVKLVEQPTANELTISAADVARKRRLENRQNSLEECQVAIDFYGDIVKEFGVATKPPVKLYLNTEELKAAAELAEKSDKTDTKVVKQKDSKFTTAIASQPTDSKIRSNSRIKNTETNNVNDVKGNSRVRTPSKTRARSDSSSPTRRYTRPTTSQENERTRNVSKSRLRSESKSPVRKYGKQTAIKTQEAPQNIPRGARRSESKSPTRKSLRNTQESNLMNPRGRLRNESKSPTRKLTKQEPIRNVSKSRLRSESKSPTRKGKSRLDDDNTRSLKRSVSRESRTVTSKTIQKPVKQEAVRQYIRPSLSPQDSRSTEELTAAADQNVRSVMSYLTDLAMFIVACWFYIFKDERLAIPILALMLYRQLHEAVRQRIPKWMKLKKKE